MQSLQELVELTAQGCCADSEAALKVAEREEKAEKGQQRASLCAFLFPLEV